SAESFIDALDIHTLTCVAHFAPVNTEGGDQIEIGRRPAQLGAAIHIFINSSSLLIEACVVEIIHRRQTKQVRLGQTAKSGDGCVPGTPVTGVGITLVIAITISLIKAVG